MIISLGTCEEVNDANYAYAKIRTNTYYTFPLSRSLQIMFFISNMDDQEAKFNCITNISLQLKNNIDSNFENTFNPIFKREELFQANAGASFITMRMICTLNNLEPFNGLRMHYLPSGPAGAIYSRMNNPVVLTGQINVSTLPNAF